MHIINIEKLRKFIEELLIKVGLRDHDAIIIADHLIKANLRGVDSHGVIRIPYYVDAIEKNKINPRPNIKIIKTFGPIALIDGDNGLGHISAFKATKLAISNAKKFGISLVGVINLKHAGMLAYYIEKIINNKMIGIAIANASPNLALPGFKKPIVGTNPLAIGFPAPDGNILLDMAMSIVAKGKILFMAKKGEKLPVGWALNKEGIPTTDPHEAIEGMLLPIGGYKGLGLAMAIDILCGILIGGKYGLKLERSWYSQGGFIISALNIDIFKNYDEYIKEMKSYIKKMKSIPTIKGTQIMLPGEPEIMIYNKRVKEGIQIDDETYNLLTNLAIKYNLKSKLT